MYLNPQSIKKLAKALKVVNQRISEIGKQFGRDSTTYKNAISAYESADLEKYIGTSASGNFKFNIRAINKDLRSGDASKAVERILNAAGFREGKPGFLRQTKEGKLIPTVKELKKKWAPYFDSFKEATEEGEERELTKEEIYSIIEEAEALPSDFTSLIYEYESKFGSDEMARAYPDLFGKGTRGELSKSQYMKIKRGMMTDLVHATKQEKRKAREKVAALANE